MAVLDALFGQGRLPNGRGLRHNVAEACRNLIALEGKLIDDRLFRWETENASSNGDLLHCKSCIGNSEGDVGSAMGRINRDCSVQAPGSLPHVSQSHPA